MNARSFAIALLLVVPCLCVLAVPFYQRTEPAIGGVPFFYWYQLAWAPLSAVCLAAAAVLAGREAA